jgi:signal peptidase I
LGQIYNGELIKGISYYIILLTLIVFGCRTTVSFSDGWLIVGTLGTMIIAMGIYVFAIIDSYRRAATLQAIYPPTPYNRWYFYLAVWLLGFILIPGAVFRHVTENYLEAYKIPTGSMEPQVRQGDRLLADKSAYRRMAPQKGDIVIFLNPDNRSQRYIKRVEALPGDTVTSADGTQQKVPHGFVYVLGDNREHSVDSREFGFIPLRDVIAKARQIYFSSGNDGIRWSRIGTTLN